MCLESGMSFQPVMLESAYGTRLIRASSRVVPQPEIGEVRNELVWHGCIATNGPDGSQRHTLTSPGLP